MVLRGDERLRMRRLLLLVSAAIVLVAACGDDELADPTSSSPTPAPPSATASPTPSQISTLHEVDFSVVEIAGLLINAAGGGEVLRERVQFLDLTGDGVEEAVVVVESGGTLGDLGAGVFALIDGQPELVQFIPTAGRIEVRLGLVVAIEGVPSAGDAQCCPSQLRETSYQWDGARFAVITEQVVPNTSQ